MYNVAKLIILERIKEIVHQEGLERTEELIKSSYSHPQSKVIKEEMLKALYSIYKRGNYDTSTF